MKKTISVFMAALNEEAHIQSAIEAALSVFPRFTEQFELLVFNDGSTDQTGQIADHLARQHSCIRVFHHQRPMGLAQISREGLEQARYQYLTWFPGDGSIQADAIIPVLEHIGQADIIVAYTANARERPFLRRLYSSGYTRLINTIFGLRMRYYNGPSVYPVPLLKALPLRSEGHAFFAEWMIRALRMQCSYREVPFRHDPLTDRYSKSVHWESLFSVLKMVAMLWWDIHINPGFFNRKIRLER